MFMLLYLILYEGNACSLPTTIHMWPNWCTSSAKEDSFTRKSTICGICGVLFGSCNALVLTCNHWCNPSPLKEHIHQKPLVSIVLALFVLGWWCGRYFKLFIIPISGWLDHVKLLIAKTQSPEMRFPSNSYCITIVVGDMPHCIP